MPNDKYFSEKEVAEIIRRAGEIQEEKAEGGYAPGVAADELRKLALEVGIQPEYLELALKERAGTNPAAPKDKNIIERIVPVEVDPADYDMITDVIKLQPMMSTGTTTSGGVTQFGRTMMGQASETWDNPHFKINSRGGRTKIEVWSDKTIPIVISILWFIPLLFSIVAGKLAGPLVGAVVAVLVCIMAVLSYRSLDKKAQNASVIVADKLEKAILEYGETKKSELAARLQSTTKTEESASQTISE
ncbi:MAG TPA: hypothetical protein VK171_16740 [Fimbriimonas sp.]|nr:hypothetical protein [Fimbriimonas sp.]